MGWLTDESPCHIFRPVLPGLPLLADLLGGSVMVMATVLELKVSLPYSEWPRQSPIYRDKVRDIFNEVLGEDGWRFLAYVGTGSSHGMILVTVPDETTAVAASLAVTAHDGIRAKAIREEEVTPLWRQRVLLGQSLPGEDEVTAQRAKLEAKAAFDEWVKEGNARVARLRDTHNQWRMDND